MLENFHFIQPLWLLALIPLMLLAWRVYRPGEGDNPWRRVVDARLLPLLLAGRTQTASRTALYLLAAGWIIAALALANPTWEKKPEPVYQTTTARVVVLDLSRSMDAADLKPSRLVRARYKIEDVLAQSGEGQTGLVVYSGDAFTVSPLTRDVNTIRALLPALDPGIMPAEGSRADLGLLRAGKLLSQAGASSGQVLLIADGVAPDQAAASERAAATLKREGYRVSVLGVGTAQGAPLTDAQGRLVRNASGNIEHAAFDSAGLRAVARAGGGEYRSISDNGQALSTLLGEPLEAKAATAMTQSNATKQGWKEQGPLLAVLLLPLAALAFRRNWLFSLVLLAGLVSPPRPAMASTWDDLWHRPDQQAAQALDAGDYAKAATLATDALRRGSAQYKRGDYKLALENFSRSTGADADYNRGNALAKLGRYEDAIAAYDRSIKENSANEDARANKAAVEALLKQQQAKQQNANSQGQQSQKNQGQGGRSGQNSSQGKSGQTGAQGQGQEQQAANANKPDGGPKKGEASGEQGKGKPGQKAASAKGSDKQEQTGSSAARQEKSGNQFADAAKKLAQQRAGSTQADAQASPDKAPGAAPGAQAAGRLQAAANAKQPPQSRASGSAQPLDSEEQMAAEQWLRRVPDDPGGLLRRKFLYQYRQRAQHPDDAG
ncbi:MAG: VWA domain-containing protein [Burkholderiales bacterium]|nr:VWA domain-containing protein [Burkholderiales bacterium]